MECIFCEISEGEVPCHKVWENEEFLAFLDIEPKVEGMTVVITKDHYDSHVFEMPDDKYSGLFKAAKKVAGLLKKDKDRVFMVVEGMDVNHVHIKLYPVNEDNNPLLGKILKNEVHKGDLEDVLKKI